MTESRRVRVALEGTVHTGRRESDQIVLDDGRTIAEARERGAQVSFTGIRRQGILGRHPDMDARLRDGDIVVIYGPPDALEHAESILLAG